MDTGTVIVAEGIEVKCYPDNDGGYWYYHPRTGQKKSICPYRTPLGLPR